MNISTAFDVETRALLHEGIARFSRDYRAQSGWPPRGDRRLAAPSPWARIARDGWLALGLPDDAGGSGAAIGDLLPLMRSAGECLWPVPLIASLGLACGALLALRPSSNDLLRQIANGEIVIGMADDMASPRVHATITATGIVLNGKGPCAFGGRVWDTLLLPVTMESPTGMGLVAVDNAASGLTCADIATIDGHDAVAMAFQNTPARLLEAGDGAIIAARARGSLLTAAEASGIAQAALAATTAYLGMRRQFGQPILQFQAIQHRLVEMHIRARELNAMLEAASVSYDAGAPDLPQLLLRLRAQSAKTATWIAQQALQLHGGMGMTQELPIGGYYTRALFIDSMFGSYDNAIDRLSALVDFPETGD